MKKIICTSLLCVCSSVAFSQLKVTSDGKVGVGITATPISNFTAGTAGEVNCRSVFQSDIVTLRVNGLGNSPNAAQYWGTGIYVYQNVSSSRGDIGIESSVVNTTAQGSGQAIGIVGTAGNATDGHNWGVIGNLYGNYKGAGILGIVGGIRGIAINDGQYAGYFHGNVKVTGTVNAVVVGNSDIRYKENIEEFGTASKSVALNNILRLNPISYNYKQIYLEAENTADSISTYYENNFFYITYQYCCKHFI